MPYDASGRPITQEKIDRELAFPDDGAGTVKLANALIPILLILSILITIVAILAPLTAIFASRF